MTGSSTRTAMFALLGRTPHPSDAVQSRVAAAHPRTHAEEIQATVSHHSDSTAKRSTHPGDILYWAACLGGAGLLLLFALR